MTSRFKRFLLYTLISVLKPFFNRHRRLDACEPPKKILLIKNDHLGDVLMITPLIRELHTRYPDCLIDVLIKEASLPAVKNNYRINNVICLNTSWTANPGQKKDGLFKTFETIIYLRDQNYDHIVCLQDSIQSQIFAFFAGRKSLIAYENKAAKGIIPNPISENITNGIHIVRKNLISCDRIDAKEEFSGIVNTAWLDKSEFPLEYFIDYHKDKDYQEIRNLLPEEYIAVHPGAGSPNKMMPPQKTANVCMQFIKKGYSVALIGRGQLDISAGKTIMNFVLKKNFSMSEAGLINLIEKNLDLDETAWVIKNSAILISHDTGTMHLASALKSKNLAVFGPTDEKIWGPWNKEASIYAGPRKCNTICGASNVCPGLNCLNNIDEQALVNRALSMIEAD